VAISIGFIVSRRLRRNIDDLADYYEGLLHIADEQSRQAESANRLKDEFFLRKPLNLDKLRQALRRIGGCRTRSARLEPLPAARA